MATEEDARAAMDALRLAQITPAPDPPSAPHAPDTTSFLDATTDVEENTTLNPHTSASSSASAAPKGILKKKGKPKLTNKEKKERGVLIERIVSSLPLEFRGNDPNLRRHIEIVIEGFLDREGKGLASAFSVSVFQFFFLFSLLALLSSPFRSRFPASAAFWLDRCDDAHGAHVARAQFSNS